MQVSHTVEIDIGCSVEQAFDFVTALDSPAKVFGGYGPISAVLETTVEGGGPLVAGAVCRVSNRDGTVMRRTITVLDRPRRHEYVVDGSGFRPVFRMMVSGASGTWTFERRGGMARVVWTYAFELRSWFWWLAVTVLGRIIFGTAMQRCMLATKSEIERALPPNASVP